MLHKGRRILSPVEWRSASQEGFYCVELSLSKQTVLPPLDVQTNYLQHFAILIRVTWKYKTKQYLSAQRHRKARARPKSQVNERTSLKYLFIWTYNSLIPCNMAEEIRASFHDADFGRVITFAFWALWSNKALQRSHYHTLEWAVAARAVLNM